MTKRVHIIVSGQVQGVWFRAHTQERAQELGLEGYVRNLDSGDVEIVAEGEEEMLADLAGWAHEGPPLAEVSAVQVAYSEPAGMYSGFHIAPGG